VLQTIRRLLIRPGCFRLERELPGGICTHGTNAPCQGTHTNTIERLHRIVAIGRHNALFAGSDSGARSWAIFTSLIQTAKLTGLNPFEYLKDVLERMVSGDVKAHELDRLLPWAWKAERSGLATAA